MELFYKIVRPLIKVFFRVVYRPIYEGLENIAESGGVVLAGNHTNNLDCLALITATKRPIHFLGKHTLFKGFKKIIFKGMCVIPVDRTKSKNHEALEQAIDVLNNGQVIGIFPESTINRTDDVIMPFKMGAVKMAHEASCPIVPFSIKGKYRPFKKGLVVTFGEPIVLGEDLSQANERLMKSVISLLERE